MNTGVVMTTEMAQKTIIGCLEDYLTYLKNYEDKTDSTIKKYRTILQSVLKNISVPFMRIDSGMLNELVTQLYKDKKWSSKYTKTIITLLNDLFDWAKNYDGNKPYTLLTVQVKSPTNSIVIKQKSTRNWSYTIVNNDVVTIPNKCDKTKQNKSTKKSQNKTYENKTVIKTEENNSSTTTEIILDTKRDKAIEILFRTTNLNMNELIDLNIYDFIHTRIIVQAKNDRRFMRIIELEKSARDAIYTYLMTRDDNYEFLFMSSKLGVRIKESEIETIYHKIKDFDIHD